MSLSSKEVFIKRIEYATKVNHLITLIVGAPISFDYRNRKGVADVSETITSIREAFRDDKSTLESLDAAIELPHSNPYQKAFETLIALRGARYANNLIRESVLRAYQGNTGPSTTPEALSDGAWYLPPAVDALGKMLANRPEIFGHRIITTNFDPLIEVAIRRHGGQCFSSFYHRDGSPSTTDATGVNVIHLHGFWEGSDTLHTPTQLKQSRPQLKNYLLDLFRRTLVVVIAYGGWDDVVSSALGDVVSEDVSDPELLWGFRATDASSLELQEPQIISRLRAGIDRGRVQMYGGIDCHEVLPSLCDILCSKDSTSAKPALSPLVEKLTSQEDRLLAQIVGLAAERYVDTAPRIDGFIGRQFELDALNRADASVICISGLGGQGKSALAAKFSEQLEGNWLRDWRDCREEGNTSHTAIALFLQRLTNGAISAEMVSQASPKELIDLVIHQAADKRAVLVLDNVDTYVDIDQNRPLGIIEVLCERVLDAKTNLKIVLTCRPSVSIANARFFELKLSGLDEESVRTLFKNKSGGGELDDADCGQLMHLTDGHPLYVSMLAAQLLSTQKTTKQLFAELEGARSEVPALIMRSTYKLLKPEQQEVVRLLAELERPEHESDLEDVTGQRYNKLTKSLRRLKDLSLVLERQDHSGKTLIDIHPLVRQFLRREYPKKDRDSFISRVILYFDRRLAIVAQYVGQGGIPRSVLDVWTHKIEILCNQGLWDQAISELIKVESELDRAGQGEEFARLGVKVLSGVDWERTINESKDFRKLINKVSHELSYRGDHDEVSRWLKHYSDAVGARGADLLNILECSAFDAWLRKDYGEAIDKATHASLLAQKVDVSLPSSPSHTLALALRDSGEVDKALSEFLEGLSLEEALTNDNGKSGPFFGNIGRCFQMKGDFDLALKFYRRCGNELAKRPAGAQNDGWIRFWVGETLWKLGKASEGHAFISAAKTIWASSSPLLEKTADAALQELGKASPELSNAQVPEWKSEKMFNVWLTRGD